MYEVRLSDNRIVIRHLDQLRPRVSDGEPVTMASGSATEELVMAEDTSAPVQEPESAGDSCAIEVPEPGGAPRSTEIENPTDTSTEPAALMVPPLRTEVTPEQPGVETSGNPLQRSTRARRPPLWYGETCFEILSFTIIVSPLSFNVCLTKRGGIVMYSCICVCGYIHVLLYGHA